MNSKIVLLLTVALFTGTTSAFAGSKAKTEKFKVHGNCGMCENRIEQAAKTVEGVSLAEWDKKTMFMTVSFDPAKTDVHKVHSAIAKAGHDTEMQRASDKTYEKLHSCCKYERAEVKPSESSANPPAGSCPHSKAAASCCG